MVDVLTLVIRFLHIGAAIAWIGGATMWSLLLFPALAEFGPTLPKGVMPTLSRKVLNYLPHLGLLTVITGLLSFYLLGGFSPGIGGTTWGMIVSLGLLVAIVAVALMYGVVVPTAKKLAQAMSAPVQGAAPGPEIGALRRRMAVSSLATVALGWLVVVLMVVATEVRTA